MGYVLETVVVGIMEVNCYILGCERTREAVIIDPGADYGAIKQRQERAGLKPKCILNTHGHIDHIGANEEFGLPVLIHGLDAAFLTDPEKNLSTMLGLKISSGKAKKILCDGDKIEVGDLRLEVIHTPGHTPGSICVKCEDMLFTGDTLFREGVGRTDLAHSSKEALFKSIRERLLTLADSTKVYPGHGPASSIGHERKRNPFLKG